LHFLLIKNIPENFNYQWLYFREGLHTDQVPDASIIAGFSAWKNDFDRNVKKGEKGSN